MTDIESKRYLNHHRGGEHNFDEIVYLGILNQKNTSVTPEAVTDTCYESEDTFLNGRSFCTWADADDGWTFTRLGTYIAELALQVQSDEQGKIQYYDDATNTVTLLNGEPFLSGLGGGATSEYEEYVSFKIAFKVTAVGQKFVPAVQDSGGISSVDVLAAKVVAKIIKVA